MTIIEICQKKAKVSPNCFPNQMSHEIIAFFWVGISEYRDIINTRVIGFTFLNDIIRFPQDPYGKFGPSLNDILNGKEE